MSRGFRQDIHPVPLLLTGMTASLWAVTDTRGWMSLLWLVLLCMTIFRLQPSEFRHFVRRISKLAVSLLFVSLLQIVFRRTGAPVWQHDAWVLVTSDGLREAVLLWLRFLILFCLATLLGQVSLYGFLAVLGHLRVSLKLGLMLTMTLKLIPYMFHEAKRVLFFFRFSGVQFSTLPLAQKVDGIRDVLKAMLMRSLTYLPDTAMALEMRGWAQPHARPFAPTLPMSGQVRLWTASVVLVNLLGLAGYWFFV